MNKKYSCSELGQIVLLHLFYNNKKTRQKVIKTYFIKDVAFFKLSILVGSHIQVAGCSLEIRQFLILYIVIEESLELGIEIV